MKLLHVDAGITGPGSVSGQISSAIVEAARAAIPGLEVVYRDLDAHPVPHLGSGNLATIRPAGDEATIHPETGLSAAVIREFLAADLVVIGAPMYNFTGPSQLKAWLDRILVAGKTFRYTEAGPEGLAGDKTVIVASARGGAYAPGTPEAQIDFQEPYLRHVFGFMGVGNVSFVRAEGLAFGPAQRQAALEAALAAAPSAVADLGLGLAA